MKIGKYSRSRFLQTASDFMVPRNYADPIYNYLVYGLEPGSFFSAVLANDFFDAMDHSHPGNSVLSLKNLVSWIHSMNGYKLFWGNEKAVKAWLKMPENKRREKLEERGLILPEQEEIVLILKDEPCREPYFDT